MAVYELIVWIIKDLFKKKLDFKRNDWKAILEKLKIFRDE